MGPKRSTAIVPQHFFGTSRAFVGSHVFLSQNIVHALQFSTNCLPFACMLWKKSWYLKRLPMPLWPRWLSRWASWIALLCKPLHKIILSSLNKIPFPAMVISGRICSKFFSLGLETFGIYVWQGFTISESSLNISSSFVFLETPSNILTQVPIQPARRLIWNPS